MLYNPQLETFLCVVESGSFSKAAEKLFITAPAVIKQINSLESSLNLQLFDRTHRGLIVTEAGKSIYKDAKYIIQYNTVIKHFLQLPIVISHILHHLPVQAIH